MEVQVYSGNPKPETAVTPLSIPPPLSEESKSKLFKWNLFLAIFHIVTGIVCAAIVNKDGIIPSYSFFADPKTRGMPYAWGPVPKKLQNVVVGYFSSIFLLLAGVDHLIVATVGRSWYHYYLERNMNPFRWAEYFVSASFMHIEIAMLCGIMDAHLLYCIYGLTAITMVFGYLTELWNHDKRGQLQNKSLVCFWMGCIPHFWNWSVLLCHFFVGVSKGSPPGFVWAIIFILFILDATFAVNQYLQQKEVGAWKDYVYGEVAFCVLSLVAKQLLAWINFGGTNSLSNK